MKMRIGQGYDIHRLTQGKELVLGGIRIPSDKKTVAHSDGDVLIHALIDALLGAAALGDIGTHFPPSEERWKDADSRTLLVAVVSMVESRGWELNNADCTVILEKPKLGPHIDAMRNELSRLTGIPVDALSVKAKTKESCDAAGRRDAIEAQAAVLLLG